MSGMKVSLLPAGLPLQDDLRNFIKGETQMMTLYKVSASPNEHQRYSLTRIALVVSIEASNVHCKICLIGKWVYIVRLRGGLSPVQ